MTGQKEGRVLLLGKGTRNVKKVQRLLKDYRPDAEVVLRTAYPTEPADRDRFDLIVVTDALEKKAVSDFVSGGRRLFPRAKVLSIFEENDPGIEIKMRSAGVIFLGSYDHFVTASHEILDTVFGHKKNEGRRRNKEKP